MADRSNHDEQGGTEDDANHRPAMLRVLPCVDSTVSSSFFALIRDAAGITLLPLAMPSTLAFRIRSDQPDAIVIVTEAFETSAWRATPLLAVPLSALPTILLTGQLNPALKRRAARIGISSVLPLDVTREQLLTAIEATVAGLAVTLEPSSQQDLYLYEDWSVADEGLAEEPLTENLTPRETEVLRLMALGHGNKEIAARLAISEHTAKFHVSSVLAKLGATSRTEAVTIGIMRGLVAI